MTAGHAIVLPEAHSKHWFLTEKGFFFLQKTTI